ncbi:hypothetical protein [Nocardiopsis sp. LOL_012]|uniref:hypothetical protein n=1 Tax=Nocardiopsis sp. LOL_012 TaxID=3345409 RepID=UPI003A84FE4D
MNTSTTPHGTPSTYRYHSCRCRPCTKANTDYGTMRNRLIAYGRWQPHGDLDEVRTHLQRLISAHWSAALITETAQVGHTVVARALNDPTYQVRAATATKLLALDPGQVRPRSLPAVGAARRLRALAALGYGLPALSTETGIPTSVLSAIRRGVHKRVRTSTHDAIAWVYDRRCMTPAPDGRSARATWGVARREKWPTPLGWDDELIDLGEAELAAELDRQVSRMERSDLRSCYRAMLQGELSPLVVAASEGFLRLKQRPGGGSSLAVGKVAA